MKSWPMYSAFVREFRLQAHQVQVIGSSTLFYCMVLLFFPLSFPANAQLLHQLLPGLIWIAVLFAFFLGAERVLQADEEDGVIEQWLLEPTLLTSRIRGKLAALWVINVLPMVCFIPVVSVLFALSWHECGILLLTLAVGTPTLFLCCAMASAFSTGLRHKSVFMGLIILPLTVPVMILGSGTLTAAMQRLPVSGELALLLAMSLLTGLLLPVVMSHVVRVNID